MSKLGVTEKLERFEVRITKEFKNETSYTKIEHVKDTILRKEWYNVIWDNISYSDALFKSLLQFRFVIKSKSFKSKKDAIQFFSKIVKSQLHYD